MTSARPATPVPAAAPPAADAPSRSSEDVRRAIVVGASSGIGAALVRRLAADGWHVAALARRADKLAEVQAEVRAATGADGTGSVEVHVHDVRDSGRIPAVFEEVVRSLGGLDLLIYAAGVTPDVGPREFPTEVDLTTLAINVDGCVAWCNQAALLFQSQRSGTIVGISSVAGDRGRRGNPVYCASKAAVTCYLEALRNRLADWGVTVTTIKPGFVDTDSTRGKEGLFWLISADEAARQILAAARWKASTRYVPRRWWLVMTIIRAIPSVLFKRLNV